MSAAFSRDEILAIEQAAVRAWPAKETRDIDGWLWRCAGGASQRANSVSPLAYHGTDPDAAIGQVERLYRERGQPARFQVGTGFAAPADLDGRLAARGYALVEPVTTLARRMGRVASTAAPLPIGAEITEAASPGWMDVYNSNITPERRAPAPAILAAVPGPRAFVSISRAGQVVATALGVITGQVVVAECVGTRADVRRTGAAHDVMRALEIWGSAQGATISALQAVADNAPAQRLYAGLGYTEVNGYHYRVLGD